MEKSISTDAVDMRGCCAQAGQKAQWEGWEQDAAAEPGPRKRLTLQGATEQSATPTAGEGGALLALCSHQRMSWLFTLLTFCQEARQPPVTLDSHSYFLINAEKPHLESVIIHSWWENYRISTRWWEDG